MCGPGGCLGGSSGTSGVFPTPAGALAAPCFRLPWAAHAWDTRKGQALSFAHFLSRSGCYHPDPIQNLPQSQWVSLRSAPRSQPLHMSAVCAVTLLPSCTPEAAAFQCWV